MEINMQSTSQTSEVPEVEPAAAAPRREKSLEDVLSMHEDAHGLQLSLKLRAEEIIPNGMTKDEALQTAMMELWMMEMDDGRWKMDD